MRLITLLLLASASYGQSLLSGIIGGAAALSQAATPTFSPTAGAVTNPTSVTISTATGGCSGYIYHKTSAGVTSGDTNSTSYSVTGAVTVYAKVIGCPGYSDSSESSAAYTIAAAPTFVSPAISQYGPSAPTTTSSFTVSSGQSIVATMYSQSACGASTWSMVGNISGTPTDTFTFITGTKGDGAFGCSRSFAFFSATPSASYTITASTTGGESSFGISAQRWTGITLAEQGVNAYGASTTMTSPSMTPGGSSVGIVMACGQYTPSYTPTAGSGYTIPTGATAAAVSKITSEYQEIGSASGSYTADMVWSANDAAACSAFVVR